MARYMWKVSYSTTGMQGILKEGGTSRRALVEQVTKEMGGNLEAFYFAFGGADAYVIAELPDNVTAASIAMTVSASGAASLSTVVLLTPEEIDDATQKSVAYRAPGA